MFIVHVYMPGAESPAVAEYNTLEEVVDAVSWAIRTHRVTLDMVRAFEVLREVELVPRAPPPLVTVREPMPAVRQDDQTPEATPPVPVEVPVENRLDLDIDAMAQSLAGAAGVAPAVLDD